MRYEKCFQHPDTGITVVARYAFGKLSFEVELLEDLGLEDGKIAEILVAAYAETVALVAPFQGRRVTGVSYAATIAASVAGDQWDEGFERID
jgi:hypothetical protein